MASLRARTGWALALVCALGAPAPAQEVEPLRLGVPGALAGEGDDLAARVADETGLPVRIAIGSEYQLLDWMDKGLLDEAYVSPFTAFLLLHDEATEAAPDRPARLPERSDFDCLETSDLDASTALRTRIRCYRSDAAGKWAVAPDPAARYEAALGQIWSLASASSGVREGREPDFLIVLPTHLSVSGFATPVSWAAQWLTAKAEGEEEEAPTEQFWRLFFEHVHFHLHVPPDGWDASFAHVLGYRGADPTRPAAGTVIEFAPDFGSRAGGWQAYEVDPASGPAPAEHKRYVQHLRVARVAPGREFPQEGEALHAGLPFNHALGALFLTPGVGEEMHRIFVPARRGDARPFAFKLPEVMRLLEIEQTRSGDRELALVLPGGGVKSAYQSVLIDHLYGADYLENRVAYVEGGGPLRVDYVLGNSGGALTGAFVACLDQDDGRLLETMWKPDGENALSSTDIFGFWGLPRWLSVLMCCGVFMIVARLAHPTKKNVKKDAGSRLKYSISWTVFLAATPLVFKMANGPHGAEHVPAAAGFVYFLCVCLGLVGDNVWIVRSSTRRKATWKHVLSWMLLVVAVLCALVPGALRWLCERDLIEVAPQTNRFLSEIAAFNMPAAAIVCCVGVLLTLVAFIVRMSLDREHLRSTGIWRFGRELTVVLSVPAVTYAVLTIPQSAGMLSWLELTGPFWLWLLGVSAAYSLLLIAFARDTSIKWLRQAVIDLCARHQGRTFRIRRLSRIVLFGFLAWGWWSFTVAPAMYGNVHSNRYLRERVAAFFPDLTKDQAVPLKTVFIAPANALASNEERYFVFSPRSEGVELSDQARFLLERDHRWVQLPDPRVELLSKVVFASGSPYPIFPAHELAYPWHEADEPEPDPAATGEAEAEIAFGTCELPAPPGTRKEWLVDGGFAHDIPLEAAKIAGARQILIVDSIPESEAGGAVSYSPHQNVFSELVGNLPRVFPFLFRQSQAVDAMTRRDLFVATLVPSGDTADWPLLFDFRTPIVDRLISEAEGDLRRRLGRVQNWGRPTFR